MKTPISLWVFGMVGIITNVFLAVSFYPLLYMFTQFYLFTWIIFLILAVLFYPVLVASLIAMLKLRKWGRNIFVTITIVVNCFVVLFLTIMLPGSVDFLNLDILLTVFVISFAVYFLKPSTRALFNK
jgi:hypothetical protein